MTPIPQTSPEPPRRQRFAMAEGVGALVVLGILIGGLAIHGGSLQRAGIYHDQQSRAIIVLDNTVESLRGRRTVSAGELQALLEQELAMADIPRAYDVSATVNREADGYRIRIQRVDGRSLATIRLPSQETAP